MPPHPLPSRIKGNSRWKSCNHLTKYLIPIAYRPQRRKMGSRRDTRSWPHTYGMMRRINHCASLLPPVSSNAEQSCRIVRIGLSSTTRNASRNSSASSPSLPKAQRNPCGSFQPRPCVQGQGHTSKDENHPRRRISRAKESPSTPPYWDGSPPAVDCIKNDHGTTRATQRNDFSSSPFMSTPVSSMLLEPDSTLHPAR